jgi:hypothetical protein
MRHRQRRHQRKTTTSRIKFLQFELSQFLSSAEHFKGMVFETLYNNILHVFADYSLRGVGSHVVQRREARCVTPCCALLLICFFAYHGLHRSGSEAACDFRHRAGTHNFR